MGMSDPQLKFTSESQQKTHFAMLNEVKISWNSIPKAKSQYRPRRTMSKISMLVVRFTTIVAVTFFE